MYKNLLYPVLAGSILLAGCDDKSLNRQSTGSAEEVDSPIVTFSPSTGQLSLPNDLLFDLTGRLAGANSAAAPAATDAQLALSVLDGWSLTAPFTIGVQLFEVNSFGTTLDQASLDEPGAVVIFECPEAKSVIQQSCGEAEALSGQIKPLVKDQDYSLFAGDDGIVITPLRPLSANTGYFLAISDQVQDSFGQPVIRSDSFALLSSTPVSGLPADSQALATLIQGTNGLVAALTQQSDTNSIMYSATFTTQDVDNVANLAMAAIIDDEDSKISGIDFNAAPTSNVALLLDLSASDDSFAAASAIPVYEGTLNLPYFLPYPGIKGEPATGGINKDTYISCTLSAELCGNWIDKAGEPAWKGSALSGGLAIPASSPLPGAGTVDVIIIANPLQPIKGYIQYVHGISGTKESAGAFAAAALSAGYAIAAIDQPLHGSRCFDGFDEDLKPGPDGIYDVCATGGAEDSEYKNGDPTTFVNLASLLTTRDNLRQAANDQLALRYALTNTDFGLSVGGNNSIFGVSLGGIIASMSQGMSETYDNDAFKFTSSVLSVPGAQLGAVFSFSQTFGDVLQGFFKGSTAFSAGVAPALGLTTDEILLIQAASGSSTDTPPGFGDDAQVAINKTAAEAQEALGTDRISALAEYSALAGLAFPGFAEVFIDGATAVIDAGDPSIWATKSTTTPTLLHQVLGDTVVPNSTADLSSLSDRYRPSGYPLGGTEGLITAFGIEQSSSSAEDTNGLRTHVNFTAGSHGSSLDPSSSPETTAEMQSQIIEFIDSEGTKLTINNASVVE